MDFLAFQENIVILQRDEILLVSEFKQLLEPNRNKCKDDKTGKLGLRVIKELTYIYLTFDWKSPYIDYSEVERKEAALIDSGLTSQEVTDQVFIAACQKYQKLQDTRKLKLLRASYNAIDELRIYFETLDLTLTDTQTGKPIYTAKDVISNIASLGKVVEGLEQLESIVRSEKQQSKALRGDAEPGIFDQ